MGKAAFALERKLAAGASEVSESVRVPALLGWLSRGGGAALAPECLVVVRAVVVVARLPRLWQSHCSGAAVWERVTDAVLQ